MRTLRVVVLSVLAAAACAACGDQPATDVPNPTAPTITLNEATAPGAFYPMSPGNRWAYERTFTLQIIPEDGPPDPPEVERARIEVDQNEWETHDGRDYIVETERYSNETGMNRRLFRQDRAGLYLLDSPSKDEGKDAHGPQLTSAMQSLAVRFAANSGVDPRCVEDHLTRVASVREMLRGVGPADLSPPGGRAPGEIQTLAYPLRPNATWIIRATPHFAATVEAHEQFDGFSAWRIRIDNEFLDEDDTVHVWFSRCGNVGWRYHFSSVAYSPEGVPLGVLISDDVARAIELDVARGGCKVEGGDRGGNTRNYPMAIGNRWTYEVKSTLHRSGLPPIEATIVLDDTQDEWVEIEGRTYIKQVLRPRGPAPWTSVTYLRQDREGLYNLDPPGAANAKTGSRPSLLAALRAVPAGPEGSEATQLVYPLKSGESWTIRDSELLGLWKAMVESRERLSLPAGEFASHRIRVVPPQNRPGDVLFVWYGAEGLLKAYQRVATQIVDEHGNVIEENIVEEVWRLQSLELVR